MQYPESQLAEETKDPFLEGLKNTEQFFEHSQIK